MSMKAFDVFIENLKQKRVISIHYHSHTDTVLRDTNNNKSQTSLCSF